MSDSRHYIPAEWAEAGEGGGAPKLSGGVTVDSQGNAIAARARNRPDQRYALDAVELQLRREDRADEEEAGTVVARARNRMIFLRSPSGNIYMLDEFGENCTCPDRARLDASNRPTVNCKHEIIATRRLLAVGEYDALPVTAQWVAEFLRAADSTAAEIFNRGDLPGTKEHNIWIAQPTFEFFTALGVQQAKYSSEPMPELPL